MFTSPSYSALMSIGYFRCLHIPPRSLRRRWQERGRRRWQERGRRRWQERGRRRWRRGRTERHRDDLDRRAMSFFSNGCEQKQPREKYTFPRTMLGLFKESVYAKKHFTLYSYNIPAPAGGEQGGLRGSAAPPKMRFAPFLQEVWIMMMWVELLWPWPPPPPPAPPASLPQQQPPAP
jgi:hypothetical protein